MAAVREANATWSGDLASGKGKVSSGSSGKFKDLDVSWARRTETDAQATTSPEELLAAAHASCFLMALSHALAQSGHTAERLDSTSRVTFAPKEGGGFHVKSSELVVRGKVPGIDQATFQTAAEAAKDGCPISQALKGNVDLSVRATLES
jgi:lipoyl-dependent peroxiredoxin